MDKSILNLGPFNDCINMIKDTCDIHYGLVDSNMFYYSGECVLHRMVLSKKQSTITAPMFTLGLAIDCNNDDSCKKLINAMELKILHLIYDMANKYDIELNLPNVAIPIRSINFDLDYRNRLCIIAVLGIIILETL